MKFHSTRDLKIEIPFCGIVVITLVILEYELKV